MPEIKDQPEEPKTIEINGRTVTLFKDSPDVGPDCKCSLCNEAIEDFALRLFAEDGSHEIRLHMKCSNDLGLTEQLAGLDLD